MKEKLSKFLPYLIGASVLVTLLSLHFGWFNVFFYGAEHANVQGIDYFAVPKSFLNLLEKRSAYDTWGGIPYGPYSTWYLAHPAFSVFVASWFSIFSAWISYWLFCIFSLGILFFCAYLISKTTNDGFKKKLSFFFLLCAFPTYWMLYVGNMHAPLVLALTLIMLGIYELTYGNNDQQALNKLFIGLLISFFTKPVVLLMLPLLLMMRETRKTALKSMLIYGVVSIVSISVPLLNPQGIGWNKILNVVFDFDFMKENLNIYKNNFVLNDYMKDNSIHWFNLIAQSDYKLIHIDVFSLPVFMDVLVGHETASRAYKIPIYMSLLLSISIGFIGDKKLRLETSFLLLMAISLTFFLSYNTVWEYQFTSILPLIALLPVLREKNVFYKKYIPFMVGLGLLVCLPSFYFLIRESDLSSRLTLTIIHSSKIIPVLLLFVLMIILVLKSLKQHGNFQQLKAWRKSYFGLLVETEI